MNHTLGAHRSNRDSETPSSLLAVTKLWYVVPALLHSQDSPVKRRERFASVERGEKYHSYSPVVDGVHKSVIGTAQGPTYEAIHAAKYKRASPTCCHSGGVPVAGRGFLAAPRAPERRDDMGAGESQTSRENTVPPSASSTELEEGSVPNWRPKEEFDLHVALTRYQARRVMVYASHTFRRSSRPASVARSLKLASRLFWRRIFDDPRAFPPEFWQLFLQSDLTALEGKCRPVCVGMTCGDVFSQPGLCSSCGPGWKTSIVR